MKSSQLPCAIPASLGLNYIRWNFRIYGWIFDKLNKRLSLISFSEENEDL
jgi:hypothetical protein